MANPQTYKNHTRFDPPFHFFIAPILLLNIAVTAIWYWHHRWQHAHSGPWAILIAVVLFVLGGTTRRYALRLQNPLIRMEERGRFAAFLNTSELAELQSLRIEQIVALRFASDPELPALARRAVPENVSPKQIKEAIVSWRPDYDRV